MSHDDAHPADAHRTIRVVGAREHNLQNITVELPKRRLTVFTGVSGSGKSSLVFGTIAADSQRLINKTYPAFVQGFMPALARPDADGLEGLTTAIVVDQERLGANPRSTVGTVTDAHALLRILFSRHATPSAGGPGAYSFNLANVHGVGVARTEGKKAQRKEFSRSGRQCPHCEGLGHATDLDLDRLLDRDLSLHEGAIRAPGYSGGGWNVRLYAESGFLDPDKPIRDFSDQELRDFLHHEPVRMKIAGINMTYEGLVPRIRSSVLAKDKDAMQPHVRAFVEHVVTYVPCPECRGTRLNEAAREARILGTSIADACAMQVSDLADWVRGLDLPEEGPLLASLRTILDSFVAIGLGYLSLDRSAGSLSGGEAQRTKMVRHLGSSLTDVTYVFDEPSTGLHPQDVDRLNDLLLRLRDQGNTVLVVEHKPEVVGIADHVVDLGPGAGADGGRVVYAGDVAGLLASGTTTGEQLQERVALKETVREATGVLRIRGARRNNLRDVDADLPLGVLTVLTGVAGSGKSSLLAEALENGPLAGREDVVVVDQSPIRGSRRSNPATYTGLLEPVRKAFAKANGVKPGLFSSNSDGACPVCKGAGVVFPEAGFMTGTPLPCEECGGRRFQPEVLEHTLNGRTIAEVLEMSAERAAEFFAEGESRLPAVQRIARRLVDVGLGYLTLGQPLTSLSGGERQRLKLAARMAEKAEVYVLDEPTTGLHLADVRRLLDLLDRLVDEGKSVLVVEHHQAVMAHADRIVDLGPGAGHDGGRVVFEGTPAEMVAARAGATGVHLARYVSDEPLL